MKELSKYLWRYYKSLELRKKNVKIPSSARFNKNTIFEENIVVHKGAVLSGTYVGRNTYVGKNSVFYNCRIGRFCSISSNVAIVPATHPSSVFVSTCPSFYSVRKQNGQSFVDHNIYEEHLKIESYNTIIGNDVWIGTNVLIKGGIKVGDGAIIAMGSVVTKDVPPYSIVGGVPAKIIKYRFTEKQITKLLEIQWWNQTDNWFNAHSNEFENIQLFLEDK